MFLSTSIKLLILQYSSVWEISVGIFRQLNIYHLFVFKVYVESNRYDCWWLYSVFEVFLLIPRRGFVQPPQGCRLVIKLYNGFLGMRHKRHKQWQPWNYAMHRVACFRLTFNPSDHTCTFYSHLNTMFRIIWRYVCMTLLYNNTIKAASKWIMCILPK